MSSSFGPVSPWGRLPPEMQHEVLGLLPTRSILAFMATCKQARAVGKTLPLWEDSRRRHLLPAINPCARKYKTAHDLCMKHLCHVCFRRHRMRRIQMCAFCKDTIFQLSDTQYQMHVKFKEHQNLLMHMHELHVQHQRLNNVYRFLKARCNVLRSSLPSDYNI